MTTVLVNLGVQARLSKLVRNASSQAINFAVRKAKTLASKDIRSELNLKVSSVNQRLQAEFAKPTFLEGKVQAKKRGALLSDFPFRQLYKRSGRGKKASRAKSGVSVRQFKSSPADVLRSAFLFPLKSISTGESVGKIGIGQRPQGSKKKFDVLFGPSVSQGFSRSKPRISREVKQAHRAEFLRIMKIRKQGN